MQNKFTESRDSLDKLNADNKGKEMLVPLTSSVSFISTYIVSCNIQYCDKLWIHPFAEHAEVHVVLFSLQLIKNQIWFRHLLFR